MPGGITTAVEVHRNRRSLLLKRLPHSIFAKDNERYGMVDSGAAPAFNAGISGCAGCRTQTSTSDGLLRAAYHRPGTPVRIIQPVYPVVHQACGRGCIKADRSRLTELNADSLPVVDLISEFFRALLPGPGSLSRASRVCAEYSYFDTA